MKIKAVLFDLDGTLLPLDQNGFIQGYFKGLVKALLPLGIDADTLSKTIWQGTYAMIKNDGKKSNEDVFFDYFQSVCKTDIEKFRTLADDYYKGEYQKLASITHPTPLAAQAVESAHADGRAVVLATNPLFPEYAQHSRIRFAGLEPSDFNLITSYESEKYAKPNPQYYLSICERLGIKPEECLIGNDEREDMHAASSVGMSCFLIDDYALRAEEYTWTGEHGSFAEMIDKLKSI